LASHAGSDPFLNMNSSAEDKRYLVCIRIVGGRNPPVISTREKCERCGAAVWRANSSNSVPEGVSILCVECAVEMTKESDNFTIMPPTREQIKSIASVLKRKNN
jgi:hypothetical protein